MWEGTESISGKGKWGGTSQGYNSLVPQKARVLKRTFRVTVLDWHTKHVHRKSEFTSSNVHV